jgi:hypothetical protein
MTGESKGAVVGKRIVLLAVAAVATTLSLSSCVRLAQQQAGDDYTVNDQLTSVRLANDGGNVTIRAVEGTAGTTIHRTLVYSKTASKPEGTTHKVDGGVLILQGCGNGCEANYEVSVPSKAITLTGELGSGDLDVQDLASVDANVGSGNAKVARIAGSVRIDNGSGDVEVSAVGGAVTSKLGSGNIKLDGIKGAVTVANSSGDVTGDGLDGDVIADAKSGNVKIDLVAAHSVRAESSSGDVTVSVPKGGYKIDVDADSGDKHIGVTNDPSSKHEIYLRTGSGDLTLKTV